MSGHSLSTSHLDHCSFSIQSQSQVGDRIMLFLHFLGVVAWSGTINICLWDTEHGITELLCSARQPPGYRGYCSQSNHKGPCPQRAHSIRGSVTVKKSIRPDQDRGWGLEQHFLRTHVKIWGGVGGAPLRTWFCHYLLFSLAA